MTQGAREDRQIAEILARMDEGTVTHLVTQDYAVRVGELVSEAMRRNLSSGVLPDGKMYYTIAERTIRPAMQTGHDLINDVAVRVDRELRRRANISIKPIRPSMSDERIKATEDKACSAEWFDDVAYVLDEPVKNTVQSFADTFMEENAEGLKKLGLRPKVTRSVVGSCCDWCAERAGIYIRGEEPEGFYRRHDYCRCTVTYDPGTGKVQDAHSKKWYSSEQAAIDKRISVSEGLSIEERQEIIAKRIAEGEISLKLSHQQYLKHIRGTPQYEKYKISLLEKENTQPSVLYLSEKEAQEVLRMYAGRGYSALSRNGVVMQIEYVTIPQTAGQYQDMKGVWHETHRVAIHYGKKGSHLVPVKE